MCQQPSWSALLWRCRCAKPGDLTACAGTLSENMSYVSTTCLWFLVYSWLCPLNTVLLGLCIFGVGILLCVSCTDLAFSKDKFSMQCGHIQGMPGDSSVPPCVVDVPSVQVTLCWALFCHTIWSWSCWGSGLFLKPSLSPSLPQTSTAMVSSVTMSCMSSSRKPTCLFLGTKSERSSRNSWSTVTRIKMGRLVSKSSSM